MKRKILKILDNENNVLTQDGEDVALDFADTLRVELRNNKGTLLTYIDNLVSSLTWDWNRIGGCGKCDLKLKTEWDGVLAGSLTEDAEIRIYLRDQNSLQNELWYSGFIDNLNPEVTGQAEYINVYCLGYVHQLKRIQVRDKTYSGQEVSLIVKNIIDNYIVTENSISIQSTTPYYQQTDFIVDSVYFDENAFDCITKLADIAGKREWGVDAEKKFFFKERDDEIKKYYFLGEDIVNFKPNKDYGPIITRVYVEGRGYSGVFTVSNRVTLREEVIQNSSIITQSVGQQFARMYLKEKSRISQSYSAMLVAKNNRLEKTVPIGRIALNSKIGINNFYDVAGNLYDAGLKYDGGTEVYQINSIKYTLGDDGVNIAITLGQEMPSISEEFKRLENMIQNERNS